MKTLKQFKEEYQIEEEDRTTDIMSFLKDFKGGKPRGSVADQKAARDALIAKRKETNPNPPQLGSSSSDKYKLGDYDKKSNRSYSEEYDLEEDCGAYETWDPKHPNFVKNYKKYQKDNAGKGSIKDFIDKEKARPRRLPK